LTISADTQTFSFIYTTTFPNGRRNIRVFFLSDLGVADACEDAAETELQLTGRISSFLDVRVACVLSEFLNVALADRCCEDGEELDC